MPELRRERRVAYHTRVRLRAPDDDRSVVARMENLSAGGTFVTAPEVPAAGSEVLCRITVAGEPRTLRGRVAWVRPPGVADDGGEAADAAGAGIEFVDLSDTDAQLIARLIEPDDSERQSVDVHFEGLPAPIKSHAVIGDEGLQISTRLPFLRLRSSVRVNFTRDGVAEVRTGTLESVTLEPSHEDGVPRLRLVVSTPQLDGATGVIEVPIAGPVPEAVEGALLTEPLAVDIKATDPDLAPVAAAPRATPDDHTQRVVAPRPRARRGRTWAIAALAVAAAGALALSVRPWRRPAPPVVRRPAPVSEAARPAVVHIEPIVHTRVEPPPAPAPSAAPARAADARPTGIEVEEGVAGGSMFLPCVGTLRGMQRYALADPPGVTVNLPRARPRASAGAHQLGSGAFRRLVVQLRGAGSQVRVFVAPDLAPDVTLEPGGLRISARPRRNLGRRP